MANFAGFILSSTGQLTPLGRTSDLNAAQEWHGLSLSVSDPALGATKGVPQPALAFSTKSLNGARQELFGAEIFERILMLPAAKALGFVITATQFPVEVWNTSRNVDQTLDSIAIMGSGGVTLADPFGEPLLYAAMDSRIYQATAPSSGPPAISESIVFTFAGGLTATLPITGERIVVLSVALNWENGFDEKISYLTDVLKAYNDNEQRRGLRQLARRSAAYTALALAPRNSAGMEALVWGWQQEPYAVPWWPDAQMLASAVAAGSFVIPVNTADRLFAAGGYVLLFQDEFTFEALTVSAVAANSITVVSPTQFSWNPNTTLVIPALLARAGDSVKVKRMNSFLDEIAFSFSGEAMQAAPAPSATFTQYKGFDVLEIAPNWESDLERTYKRSLVRMDPKVGPITVDDKGGSAVVSHDFPWFIVGHPNVTTFRAFILKRFGRLNPFWMPTWDQDLTLAANVASTDSSILVQSEFYSRFFFPNQARRFVAFIPVSGGGNVYKEVLSATDNGNGTETLVLDSQVGTAFAMGSVMLSFLTFGRLASDDAEIRWLNNDLAESVLSIQEVPREVPS